MLKVDNLSFTYPSGMSPVFEKVSFEVSQGDVWAIIGKNGCGKTTLIKCITGILKPQEGDVDIVGPVGYVPQQTNIVYDMSVLDAIVMGRFRYIGSFAMPSHSDYHVARRCASKLSINNLIEQNYSELSGGQQQMVLVARALAVEPKCIVFDEPCSALDYGNQNHILSIISQLKKEGITAVFSTHDPNHALHIADNVLIMREGQECRHGQTKDMITDSLLSALYGMNLKKVAVNDRIRSVVALYD